jgi:ketosteroid isomerase-like protein
MEVSVPAPLTDEFIRGLQGFERTGEVAPLVALFHEDGEAVNLGRTEPARGHEEIEGFWRDYRAVFRTIRSEFTHVIEGQGGAVLEWVSRGALSNGEPVEYKGVTVLEVEDGRVRRCRTYYDSAVFMSGGAATEGS